MAANKSSDEDGDAFRPGGKKMRMSAIFILPKKIQKKRYELFIEKCNSNALPIVELYR